MIKIIELMSFLSFVTVKPTSVPPERIVASGFFLIIFLSSLTYLGAKYFLPISLLRIFLRIDFESLWSSLLRWCGLLVWVVGVGCWCGLLV